MKKIILGLIMFLVFFGVSFAKEYNYRFYTGDFGYMYEYILKDNEGKNLGKYINVNGKVYGPYIDIKYIGTLNDGKGYYFYARVDKNRNYLNINGKTFYIGENESAGISFGNIDTTIYKIRLKKVKKECNGSSLYEIVKGIKEKNKEPECYDKYFYIFINGKEYGPYFTRDNYNYVITNKKGDFLIFSNPNTIYNGKIIDQYGRDGILNNDGYLYIKYVNNYLEYIYNGKKIHSIKDGKYRDIKLYKNNYLIGYYNILADEKTGKRKRQYFFIINGKKYGPYNIVPYDSISYLGAKGFAFIYGENYNNYYININGKVFGPYKDIDIKYFYKIAHDYLGSNKIDFDVNTFIYTYKIDINQEKILNKKWGNYLNINGKDIYLGKYGKFGSCKNLKNGKYLCYYYIKDNQGKERECYINFNGKIINKFISTDKKPIDIYIPESIKEFNFYGYILRIGLINSYYIYINGEEYGPYEEIGNFKFYEGGYYYSYKGRDGKYYLNINGKNIFSSEKSIKEVHLFEENNNYKFIINLYDYENNTGGEVKIENIKKIVKINKSKPNPKLDKILNKFFAKIDKKGEAKAKIIYKKVIQKIDAIISKTTNSKKKQLLEYIKTKFEEKLK